MTNPSVFTQFKLIYQRKKAYSHNQMDVMNIYDPKKITGVN